MRLAQRLLAEPELRPRENVCSHRRCRTGAYRQPIFVVDDDSALREAMRDLLQERRIFGGDVRRRAGLLRSLSSRMGRMRSGRCADARHERHRADRTSQSRRPRTARHRHHRQWRRANGRSGDEGWSCGLHREACRPRRPARQRRARTRSDAGCPEVVCIAGDGLDARCQLDNASTADPRPRACRPSKQEHRRRSRHQPANGRQPSCCDHAEDRLEVPSQPWSARRWPRPEKQGLVTCRLPCVSPAAGATGRARRPARPWCR